MKFKCFIKSEIVLSEGEIDRWNIQQSFNNVFNIFMYIYTILQSIIKLEISMRYTLLIYVAAYNHE